MSEELVNGEQVVQEIPQQHDSVNPWIIELLSMVKHNADSKQEKPSEKASRVLTEKEMGRMIDMGLRRGVDATDASP